MYKQCYQSWQFSNRAWIIEETLEAENAEISELKKKLVKFAELEAENAKLRQIIKENTELKAEVAKLRHDIEEIKLQTSP